MADYQGGLGNDGYVGTNDADRANGNSGNDILYGVGGNDILNGDDGQDTLNGGTEDDALNGGRDGDQLFGEDGNDVIIAGTADFDVDPGSYDLAYYLDNTTAFDVLSGGGGNDTLLGGSGDSLDGGSGTDVFSVGYLTAGGPLTANFGLAAGGATVIIAGGTFTGLEAYSTIFGTNFNDSIDVGNLIQADDGTTYTIGVHGADGDDTLSAGNGNNLLFGDAGIDVLSGGDGNDTLHGGAGGDFLDGGAGNDVVSFAGRAAGVTVDLLFDNTSDNDTLSGIEGFIGSSFDDFVYGGLIDDNLFAGGLGKDSLSYVDSDSAVAVSLAITTAQNTIGAGFDTITGFEQLEGSYFADTLTGSAAADTLDGGVGGNDSLSGGDGDDLLIGRGGDDTLDGGAGFDIASFADLSDGIFIAMGVSFPQGSAAGTKTLIGIEGVIGGTGDDTFTGSASNDFLDGGDGNDLVSYELAGSGVTIDLDFPEAQDTGGAGTDTLRSIEHLYASLYDDSIKGNAADNDLFGSHGNDTLEGRDGDDTLAGGDGIDTVSYADASAAIGVKMFSTTAQDTDGAGIDILSGFENVLGSAFEDAIEGDGGDNVLDGNGTQGGRDRVLYETATAAVTVDLSIATAQNTGGAGTDTIIGFGELVGSAFDDTLSGNSQDNFLAGGAGIDTVSYAGAGGGITLSLAITTEQNTFGAGTDAVIEIENVLGSAYADKLTGNSGANTIEGGLGNDTLNGGTGIDRLSYKGAASAVSVSLALTTAQNTIGAGTDTVTAFENLSGSAYNDTLTGSTGANAIDGALGNDTLNGGDGNDTLTGGLGSNLLSGGLGDDFASYAAATAAVTVKLAITGAQNTVGAGTDTLSGIESVIGSGFGDNLQGSNADNQLMGGDGDDTLLGGLGNDYLLGAGGRDTASYITATAGVTIDLALTVAQNTAGAGMDRIVQVENLRGSAYADSLKGNAATNSIVAAEGNDTVYGFAGNDTLTGGTGLDTIYGGDAQDTIQGGDDADTIWGEPGLDNIKGDAGSDTLHGGLDNDTINGGTGDDVIYGEAGRDILIGDTGLDRFVYATTTESPGTATGRDQIRDFSHAQGDKIDLSAIDAITGGANNAFAFIGTGAFTGVAGQLNIVLYGSNWIVQGDVNGDKIADVSIQVTSATALAAADFVL